jgi:hypothetical protein
MVYSSNDFLAMVAELNVRRVAMVMSRRQRRMGGMMLLTEQQTAMLATCRKMHQRYLQGDYRHHSSEVGTINDLCNWMLEEHAKNEHLLKVGTFNEFTPASASSKTKLPSGRYNDFTQQVHQA